MLFDFPCSLGAQPLLRVFRQQLLQQVLQFGAELSKATLTFLTLILSYTISSNNFILFSLRKGGKPVTIS